MIIKPLLLVVLLFFSASLAANLDVAETVANEIAQKVATAHELSEVDPDKTITMADALLDIAEAKGDIALEAEAKHLLGIAYRKLGRYNSAIDKIQAASELFTVVGDRKKVADTYNTIGLIRAYQGKYALAMQRHIDALEIRREINDQPGIAISYNNLGNSFRNSGELEKSAEYLIKSIELKLQLDMPKSLAYSYNNLGHTFRRMEDYEKAQHYYTKALDIRQSINHVGGIANSLNNIGRLLQVEGKLEDALANYQQGLQTLQSLGDMFTIVGAMNNVGSVYSEMGRTEDALTTLFEALAIGERLESPVLLVDTLQLISRTYENDAEYQKALIYMQRFFEEHNRVFNESNSEQLYRIQADFGVKENELKVQHIEELAAREKAAYDTEFRLFVLVSVLLLLVVVLFIQRYRFVSKANQDYKKLYADLESKTQALAKANCALEELSITDSLTNLHNRRVFDEQLSTQLAAAVRGKKPLSVLLFDLDSFKRYNDEFGHQQGDVALKAVADILNSSVNRPEDTVCRYGGEEFVIILPNTPSVGAAKLGEKVRQRLQDAGIKAASEAEHPLLSVSVGTFTMVPDRDTTPEFLVREADTALYEAKAKGKNCVIAKRHNSIGTVFSDRA